jgi:hypothetical protein
MSTTTKTIIEMKMMTMTAQQTIKDPKGYPEVLT